MAWNEQAVIECHFRFTCPRLWSRLERTEAESIRHCPACDRDVYLVLTEESFRAHAAHRHCVAVPLAQSASTGIEQQAVDYVVGSPASPYNPLG